MEKLLLRGKSAPLPTRMAMTMTADDDDDHDDNDDDMMMKRL